MLETVPISSPSQSLQILFARVVFSPLGGPYRQIFTCFFFAKRSPRTFFTNCFNRLNTTPPPTFTDCVERTILYILFYFLFFAFTVWEEKKRNYFSFSREKSKDLYTSRCTDE